MIGKPFCRDPARVRAENNFEYIRENESTIREGVFAPDFTFTDCHGNMIKLSDLRGRRVVIYFYPKDFTPGCTTEGSRIRRRFWNVQGRKYRHHRD